VSRLLLLSDDGAERARQGGTERQDGHHCLASGPEPPAASPEPRSDHLVARIGLDLTRQRWG